jgi:hypothetical protein
MSETKKLSGRNLAQVARSSRSRRRRKATKSEKILQDALEAVAANRTPYINGAENLGTLDVPDPLEEQEIIRAGRGHFVRKKTDAPLRTRVISLRDDPVGQMAKRGQLGDSVAETEIRLKAARRWQRLYEVAEIGGARGIDPTRDIVDGGGFQMPDTDKRLTAQAELNQLRQALGIVGDRIVTWVLGYKYSLGKVLVLLGRVGRIEQKAIGSRFRECLDTIAVELGISIEAKGARGPRRRRDAFDDAARYAWSPQLHRAVLAAKARP